MHSWQVTALAVCVIIQGKHIACCILRNLTVHTSLTINNKMINDLNSFLTEIWKLSTKDASELKGDYYGPLTICDWPCPMVLLHSCTWRFRLSTDPKIPAVFSLAVVLTTYFGLSQKCKKILSSVIAEAPAPYVHVFAPIIHYSRLIVSTRFDLCIVNRLLSFSSQYRKPIPPHFIVSWMISVIIFVPHNRNPLSIPFYKPKIIYKASERFLKIYLSYKL